MQLSKHLGIAVVMVAAVQTAVWAGGVLKMDKTVFKADEPIVVKFMNLPGNKTDWITILKVPAKNADWEQWSYTDGKKNGSLTFKPLPPGDYEARLLYDYPRGGDKVHFKIPFSVK